MSARSRVRRVAIGVLAGAVTIGVAGGCTSGPAAPAAADQKPVAAATPADGRAPAKHHFVTHNAGRMYPRDLVSTELKLTSAMTDGRLNFIDEIWKPGFKVVPHFHTEHSEAFYVLSGQVEWTVNGETHVLGAGDLVHIPADAVHSVSVVGSEDVRTLMIYEPGGYEEHLDEEQQYTPEQRKQREIIDRLRANFDFNPASPEVVAAVRPASQRGAAAPPERHAGSSVRLIALAPEPAMPHFSLRAKGETYQPENEVSEVKLSAVQTDGRYSFLDEIWKPGMAVPPHFHAEHTEVFYIVSGQVEWTVGGETQVLGPGDLVYIPADTVHSVTVVGDKDVQSLMLYNPGGYEYYWRREQQYTPDERKEPEIQRMLRAKSDFHPVVP